MIIYFKKTNKHSIIKTIVDKLKILKAAQSSPIDLYLKVYSNELNTTLTVKNVKNGVQINIILKVVYLIYLDKLIYQKKE